jgi:hypothetical protein
MMSMVTDKPTKAEWQALGARIEAATASDWAIDEVIMRALGLQIVVNREGRWVYDAETDAIEKVPELTESIDAITALIGRELPGATQAIVVQPKLVTVRIDLEGGDVTRPDGYGQAMTEALARCAAFCRAKADPRRTLWRASAPPSKPSHRRQ